ncbi:beta-1 adrenergic receptor-like [Montipora foliosa]|uniref:beta-1 adrenergic receptor-like n=1 Tax=Montipora foliosa TaxID=591990 RepID=UPI0035F16A0D
MSFQFTPCEWSANLSDNWRVVFIFLNSMLSAITLGGNAVVLLSIYRVRSLRTTSNMLIASLAASDLLVGLLVNPTYIALTAMKVWFSSHPVYKMENFLWAQSLVTSTFTLCAISVDRFFAVTSAIRYNQIINKQRCGRVVLSIWAAALTFGCLTLFFEDPEDASIVWILCLVFTVIMPFAIIIYCYTRIFREAVKQKAKISFLNPVEAAEMLRNRKAAWTAAIVVGLFFVTFFPNVVFSCIDVATKDPCEKARVYRHWLWAIILAFSSSAWNPFVYAVRIREFKSSIKKTFSYIFKA